MGVHDIHVAKLQSGEGRVGAFDEVLAREAQVVDFAAGAGERGVVRAPIDLGSLVCTFRVVVVVKLLLWTRRCRFCSSQNA
jgi:hypothetical protein